MSHARFWPKAQSVLPIIPRTHAARNASQPTHLSEASIELTPGDVAAPFDESLTTDANTDSGPRRPFWASPDHRIPTLWHLYRSLLQRCTMLHTRQDPGSSDNNDATILSPEVKNRRIGGQQDAYVARGRVRAIWHRNASLTSPARTRYFLDRQYELLHELDVALASDMTTHKPPHKTLFNKIFAQPPPSTRSHPVSNPKPDSSRRPRPRTVGYLRPTLHNPPLPRLKPQPLNVSMMIHHRILAREERRRAWERTMGWVEDLKGEQSFRNALGLGMDSGSASRTAIVLKDGALPGFDGKSRRRDNPRQSRTTSADGPRSSSIPIPPASTSSYLAPHLAHLKAMRASFDREERRSRMKYSEEMVRDIERQKREGRTRRMLGRKA